MRLRRRLIWIPLALAAVLAAASGASFAHMIEPVPMRYGSTPHHGPGDGPGSCHEDNLQGRVCRD